MADICKWSEFDSRSPSVHRRHGDPFPLPRVGKPRQATELIQRLDDACGALNSLASTDFYKTDNNRLSLTRVQLQMMDSLFDRVSSYGPKPSGLDEEASLRDLRCGANLYTQEAVNIADFDAEEMKILNRQLTPTSASELAPPEVRVYLDNFSTMVERTDEEREALRTTGSLVEPHWDPRLRHDRGSRDILYQKLFKCGLLTYRRRQKARVGMFAVKKKGDKRGNSQRLIVDCRQANSLMRRPPTTRLSTPAGLASLDFSQQSLADNGYSMDDVLQQDMQAGIETGDVGDCFYNFIVPRACSWFSTGDIVTRQEMRTLGIEEDHIFNEETGEMEPLSEDDQVYICFGGMPMGWSWALWMANEIICHQSLLAVGGSEANLVRDKKPAPHIKPTQPPLGVYVDNIHAFGGLEGEGGATMRKISQHFESLGIPFEVDNVDGCTTLDTLGLTFSVKGGVRVKARSDRAWRLWGATRALLRRRRISGEVLRVWLGHQPRISLPISIWAIVFQFGLK